MPESLPIGRYIRSGSSDGRTTQRRMVPSVLVQRELEFAFTENKYLSIPSVDASRVYLILFLVTGSIKFLHSYPKIWTYIYFACLVPRNKCGVTSTGLNTTDPRRISKGPD